MLNGIDPIIIFNFKKKISTTTAKIPLTASTVEEIITLPVIPIYLSERLTGLFIETESKNIDVDTTIDTLSNGDQPNFNQRALSSTIKIEMQASASSIGVALLSALSDLVFPKLTSKEYSITYLHGAVTVFDGLLHSFAVTFTALDGSVQTISAPYPTDFAAALEVAKITGA